MAEMLLNLQELVSPDKEKSREEAAGDRATSHMLPKVSVSTARRG